jgi:hypothetical protein
MSTLSALSQASCTYVAVALVRWVALQSSDNRTANEPMPQCSSSSVAFASVALPALAALSALSASVPLDTAQTPKAEIDSFAAHKQKGMVVTVEDRFETDEIYERDMDALMASELTMVDNMYSMVSVVALTTGCFSRSKHTRTVSVLFRQRPIAEKHS